MQNRADKENISDELAFLSKKILELNKQLINSEKAKSKFLSLVANKLNNPMTAILGILPHLKIIDTKENRFFFELIYKEVLNLDFKIQNLMMASEIESGNIDISYALVDPIEIIEEAIETLKYLIKEKNIELKVNSKIKRKVVTDPKKVYLIVKNIISNGCRYGFEDSVLEINLDIKESIFIIKVKNQGSAPEVKYKPEIFTRFAKDASGKHGLGIGLSVVREICERLDGTIEYEAEGGFVTFIVKLPFDENMIDSEAYGSNEFLFDSFNDAIEL
ncbi:HAMP domain-containing sensor histidine kinase [Sulfurimonas sp.]|uniref:sensor histidine kinase n=1 Tax=Sulfurimonas sp. TaxID=2022749 RepID=UPI0025EBBD66|nr:HAMP domain-containing sensor histidine kinase [Sulfurimonas sp.]MCK9473991.1 HAMP domain-containing histidine kinase [Sulfurimonas sp.]